MTDTRRGESLFEAVPEARALVDEGVELEGSLLSGVSALCWWEDGQGCGHGAHVESELCEAVTLDKVHLKFNIEAMQLLPLAIRLGYTCNLIV